MKQCSTCGSPVPDSDLFCTNCGTPVQSAAPQPEVQQTAAPQPVVQQPEANANPQQGMYTPPVTNQQPGTPQAQYQYQPPQAQGGNGIAIPALIFGILTLVFFWVPFLNFTLLLLALGFTIPALIMGIKNNSRRGLAIAATILTGISLLMVVIFYTAIYEAATTAKNSSSYSEYNDDVEDYLDEYGDDVEDYLDENGDDLEDYFDDYLN